MWEHPETYLWPAYGWSFPKGNPEGWFWQWIETLLTNPWVYIPEITGGLILLLFFIKMVYEKKIQNFIYTGKLYD